MYAAEDGEGLGRQRAGAVPFARCSPARRCFFSCWSSARRVQHGASQRRQPRFGRDPQPVAAGHPLIGDLNNFMSDYRTGEGTHLLSSSAAQIRASEREIADLAGKVASAQRSYEALSHEESEARLYRSSRTSGRIISSTPPGAGALAHRGQVRAVAMYMTTSQRAFAMASDTLGRLTDQTVAKARKRAPARPALCEGPASHRRGDDHRACLVLVTILYITRSVSHRS